MFAIIEAISTKSDMAAFILIILMLWLTTSHATKLANFVDIGRKSI